MDKLGSKDVMSSQENTILDSITSKLDSFKLDIPKIASPYLNLNPDVTKDNAEYFSFDARVRRAYQFYTMEIGMTVFTGSALGMLAGMREGLRNTTNSSGKTRRTQVLNHILKRGGAVSRSLGCLAVLYACAHNLAHVTRGEDDFPGRAAAATTTGAIYLSSAGLKGALLGGTGGAVCATLYWLWNGAGHFENSFHQYKALQ